MEIETEIWSAMDRTGAALTILRYFDGDDSQQWRVVLSAVGGHSCYVILDRKHVKDLLMALEADRYPTTEAIEVSDSVNHPSYYTQYKGVEVIDITEQMNFNRGNAVKYICRAGFKSPETELEDLKKAKWYLDREITRLSESPS